MRRYSRGQTRHCAIAISPGAARTTFATSSLAREWCTCDEHFRGVVRPRFQQTVVSRRPLDLAPRPRRNLFQRVLLALLSDPRSHRIERTAVGRGLSRGSAAHDWMEEVLVYPLAAVDRCERPRPR